MENDFFFFLRDCPHYLLFVVVIFFCFFFSVCLFYIFGLLRLLFIDPNFSFILVKRVNELRFSGRFSKQFSTFQVVQKKSSYYWLMKEIVENWGKRGKGERFSTWKIFHLSNTTTLSTLSEFQIIIFTIFFFFFIFCFI